MWLRNNVVIVAVMYTSIYGWKKKAEASQGVLVQVETGRYFQGLIGGKG